MRSNLFYGHSGDCCPDGGCVSAIDAPGEMHRLFLLRDREELVGSDPSLVSAASRLRDSIERGLR
jgi:hypothetical protein